MSHRRRSSRSASAPPTGASSPSGMNPAAATSPAHAGRPVREKTSTPSATVCIHDPRFETRAADQMSAKFRERSGRSDARATRQGYRGRPRWRPGEQNYLSSFTLRRGRRANHQTLAIVATRPRAAAGLAILRERSDMPLTLPVSSPQHGVQRISGPEPLALRRTADRGRWLIDGDHQLV